MPSVVADLAVTTAASPVRRRIDQPREGGASFRQQFQELSGSKPAAERQRAEPSATDRADSSRTSRRADKSAKPSRNAKEADRDSVEVEADDQMERKPASGETGADATIAADDENAANDSTTAGDSADGDDAATNEPAVAEIDPSMLTPAAVPATPVPSANTNVETAAGDGDIAAPRAGQVDPTVSTSEAANAETLSPIKVAEADEASIELAVDATDAGALVPGTRLTGKPSAGVSTLGGAAPSATSADAIAPVDPGESAGDQSPTNHFAQQSSLSMMSEFAEAMSPMSSTSLDDATSAETDTPDAVPTTNSIAGNAAVVGPQLKAADAQASAAADEPPIETRFAEANHAKIVTDVRGALLPNGGRMELRLDPPELGSLQVSLHIKDGVVTASFLTQNPEAARLLSHTLSDLRQSLEAQGVVVDKLHVQQAPKSDNAGTNTQNGDGRPTLSQQEQQENRREQQRKDMVQRLWDQLAGNAPIDVRA